MESRDEYNPKPNAIPPELIKSRSRVMERLSAAGLKWPGDFSTVELLPAVFGLMVCGLSDRVKSVRVLAILRDMFADWNHYSLVPHEDARDPGWRVKIARYREKAG